MKNRFLIIILIIFQLSAKAIDKDSIVVTYIANCGFLIEMESKKIIIDGLFTNGFNHYETPDSTTLDLLLKGSAPFDSIDYVFVTHKHADHVDAKTITDFMINNSKARLICPKQVDTLLSNFPDKYGSFVSRIVECTPDTNSSKTLQFDNIEILACRLLHGNEKSKDIENIAYRISCNGKTIFHTGDANPNLTDKYQGIIPSDKKIDIAFINGAFGNYKNFQITNKFIGADNYIAMHFPNDFFNMEHKMITDAPDYFTEPIVFKELMEKRIIYITE